MFNIHSSLTGTPFDFIFVPKCSTKISGTINLNHFMNGLNHIGNLPQNLMCICYIIRDHQLIKHFWICVCIFFSRHFKQWIYHPELENHTLQINEIFSLFGRIIFQCDEVFFSVLMHFSLSAMHKTQKSYCIMRKHDNCIPYVSINSRQQPRPNKARTNPRRKPSRIKLCIVNDSRNWSGRPFCFH